VSDPEYLAPLLRAIHDLQAWFDFNKVCGVIIGGVAASLLGRPRVTQDVDVLMLLEENRWNEFLASGAQFGFAPRRTDALAFAKRSRVLLMRHVPSGIQIDISLGALPFEKELVERARSHTVAGQVILLPSPEDLIIMKAVAHRTRDLADIASIWEAQTNMNLTRIRKWVREFAKALEMPEVYDDLEKILAKRRKRKKP